MATTIITKFGSGAPTASDVVRGELAVDTENKRLYTEDSGGSVVELGTNPAANITFGDNVKAIFGAGSDLEIYSDGTTGKLVGNVDVTVVGDLSVDGGTIKLDGNYPVGSSNVALGNTALDSLTTGGKNVAIGDSALTSNTTASNSVAIGYRAGRLVTTGSTNIYLGYTTGQSSTVGSSNVAVGSQALGANQGGSRNVAIGTDAMQTFNAGASVTNTYNVAIGYEAMHDASTATTNTALGSFALRSNTTSSNNSALGYQALYANTTGTQNVAVGGIAGDAITTSSYNTLVGYNAGGASDADFNAFFGRSSGSAVTTGAKNTIIGSYNGNQNGLDIRTASNNIVLSDGDGNPRVFVDSSGNLLVGTTTTTAGNEGMVYFNGSSLRVTRDSDEPLNLDRLTTDGSLVDFKKDGTTVGSIGTNSSYLFIGSPVGTDAYLLIGNDLIHPATSTGASKDASIDIGGSSNRFKDLYLSGKVITGGNTTSNEGTISFVADSERCVITGGYDTGGGGILKFFTDTTGGTSLQRMSINNAGTVTIVGALSKGSGSFKIDHPLPEKTETHHLVHSFVESPQADNIYRGKVDLVDGSATVNIDTVSGMTEGTFVLLNTNTQCFTSNESGWTAVKGLVSGNILTITAQESCSDTISWLVIGERHDQHMLDTDWTDENGKVIVEPLKQEVAQLEGAN